MGERGTTMKCEFCGVELEKGATVCPACGEALNAPVKKKKVDSRVWKKVLAIVGIVALGLVLTGAILNFMGLGKNVWHTMKFWRPNDINYKLSYTVKNTVAEKKKDIVVATLGNQKLTNGELQVRYWSEVFEFVAYYGSYLDYSGLDITKPLNEQYYEGTNVTYQQKFLEIALEKWRTDAIIAQLAEDANFKLSAEQQKLVDDVPGKLQKMAAEEKYTDLEKYIDEKIVPGSSLAYYLEDRNMNYRATCYYNSVYENMKPTQEQIDAYYAAHEAEFIENKIDKSAGDYHDVRHCLVGIEGGADPMGDYGTDQWAICLEAAQELLDSYLAGEQSEKAFADLAFNHSQDPGSKDNGGLYTELTKDTNFIDAFKEWYLDPERKVGDTGLVKNDKSEIQGYHIMYYVGGTPIWQREAQNAIISEQTEKMLEDGRAKWELKVDYKKMVLSTVDIPAFIGM